ncbi:class II fructose-bisphosphate aldolase, partial [Streptomyces sp. BE20]|uniref:class II fructose-bisphosphate aldolase n=1 Tax=Streptomyces sp. BE20 TaxID=3002525 RepID=UPI002E797993
IRGRIEAGAHGDGGGCAAYAAGPAEHALGGARPRLEHAPATTSAATREVTEYCHRAGVWVEAELGESGGKDGAHAPGVRTDPREACAFATATAVDALAVAVGSSHAMLTRDA